MPARSRGRKGKRQAGGRPGQRTSTQRGTTPIRAGGAGGGESRRTAGPGGARVEGRQSVRELLLAQTRKTAEIVLSAGLDPAPIIDDIVGLAREAKVPIREIGRGAFDALSQTDSAQGVLAEAAPLPTIDVEQLIDDRLPFMVMVDGVTDPNNLGAIFRSADAAGATGIVLPRHRSARVSATVTKAAAGAVEHVPIATVAGVPGAISLMRERDVWTVGLDETGHRSIFDLTVADQPLCLVLGAEGPGLSRLTRERCDELVSIPMGGAVASLNVSAAATVAMFEVVRRRLGG